MSRVSAYLGDYTYLTQLEAGPKIYVDTRELSMSAHLIADGFWESWISKLFTASLSPGATVLDIGANCGYYSLIAAMHTGPGGKVHTFEPNPFHHQNLLKSKLINGFYHMEIHKAALSDQEGTLSLYSPTMLTASASIIESLVSAIKDTDPLQAIEVTTVRLRDYLPEVVADVIKVDIEGAEPLILDDLVEILERKPGSKLFMEYNQKAWEMQGYDCLALLDKFRSRQYSIYIIGHDQLLTLVSPEELIQLTANATHFDLFITKPASAAG